MNIKNIAITLVIALFTCNHIAMAQAVEEEHANEPTLGLGLQVYPTGFMPSLQFEHPLSDHGLLQVRAGLNIFDHRDLGKQDEEIGSGFGGSLGYKHFFNDEATKWSLMLKTDVWFNTVDWRNDLMSPSPEIGTTDIVVLQPTLELGYTLMLTDHLFVTPSLAFGLEWNVQTEGEPMGEGPILLGGVVFGMKL